MEVNKKQLADIFGASIRTIQNWQEQGMPVLRGGGKGNEVLYDSAAVIKWYAERDAEIENEKLRREVKGKYTMTGEAFDPVEVDMGRSAANNITQSGGTEWSKRDKSTYDPTDDIEAYALNASGVVNIIVFDPKGWALFRSFKAVKEKLDTRRGSNSELETAVKDLGEAVSYNRADRQYAGGNRS